MWERTKERAAQFWNMRDGKEGTRETAMNDIMTYIAGANISELAKVQAELACALGTLDAVMQENADLRAVLEKCLIGQNPMNLNPEDVK